MHPSPHPLDLTQSALDWIAGDEVVWKYVDSSQSDQYSKERGVVLCPLEHKSVQSSLSDYYQKAGNVVAWFAALSMVELKASLLIHELVEMHLVVIH